MTRRRNIVSTVLALPSRILYYTNIVKGECNDKTEKHRFYSLGTAEPHPILYKYTKKHVRNM